MCITVKVLTCDDNDVKLVRDSIFGLQPRGLLPTLGPDLLLNQALKGALVWAKVKDNPLGGGLFVKVVARVAAPDETRQAVEDRPKALVGRRLIVRRHVKLEHLGFPSEISSPQPIGLEASDELCLAQPVLLHVAQRLLLKVA